MSIKDHFNNKKNATISKYLKKSSTGNIGDGIESAAHLSQSLIKRDTFVPRVDYSNPSNFAKFGSAEKYYQDAFQYITAYYPYDGAGADKLKFYNDLNSFEKYIFNEKYTKSTGYVQLGYDYGTSYTGSSGYWMPDSAEYIQIKGGPHRETKYSVSDGRTNNLTFGGPSGSTVEFFFKKSQGIPDDPDVQSGHQVVFDAWNGENVDSSAYGRLRIEIVSGSEDRFFVTMLSGTATNTVRGFLTASVPSAGGLNLTNNEWNQYSFVFNTNTETPVIDFYVNGECHEKNITGSTTGKITQYSGQMAGVTRSLTANIGAIRYAPWGSQYAATGSFNGFGKLSASLDEFRFWKKARNGQEVGRNWFTNVNGGTDKSKDNINLGVYLTFNEGITQTSSIDSVVLDYSGRISNGVYVGYDATNSRSTGSAINDLQRSGIRESGDPIVRISNPSLVAARDELILVGQNYDYRNSARLINNLPNWVIEEDETSNGELTSLLQIMSNKFDEMYAQISALSEIKNMEYISGSSTGSIDEFTHNDRLVENLGLTAPEIFENIGPYGQFLERDEQINFEQRLVDVKNTIYKNIYNNLVHIYKSKGTEKAVRNFIRCLGVGEEIISLNVYGDQISYVLKDSYKTDASSKRFVDFSGLTHQTSSYATVYQYYDENVDGSHGLITSASANEEFAFTLQGNFLFPNQDNRQSLPYSVQTMVSSSLVGFHTPDDPDVYKNDLTWATIGNDYGLQLYFVKAAGQYNASATPIVDSKSGYFCLTNRTGEVLLTSSIISDVYDNTHWNVAISVRPSVYPFAEGVAGTTLDPSGEYTLELCGYNYDTEILRNEFSVSTSMNYASGSNSLNLAKRIYAGAHRTNYTGSVLTPSDIRATGIRYWSDYIPPETVKIHARELESYGRLRPTRNMPSFQTANPNVYIPKAQTLALNWDFSNVTGSDASGQFSVTDLSSGSADGIFSDYQNTPYSEYNLRQHTGRGDLFKASSTPVVKQYVYTSKLQSPDYANSSDMVKVLTVDDETFGFDSKPEKYFFAVEKSMYQAISSRMLELFASIEEYNNLIGDPVNKYRPNYKRMEKLREIFFRRVQNDKPDLQKYLTFYKWLDSSMNRMIEQLLPASARSAPEVRTVIESHVLERPKISYKYPQSFKRILPRPLGRVGRGWEQVQQGGGWRVDHAPLPRSPLDQNENCLWWKRRIYPLNANVSSSDAGVNTTRLGIYQAIQTDISSSKAVTISGDVGKSFIEGMNAVTNRVHGVRDFKFRNFRGFDLDRCKDNPELKPKMLVPFEVEKDGSIFDGNLVSPFIALSSSVTTGYVESILATVSNEASASSVDFANLHNDFVRPNETSYPLQGPFTNTHVGGVQARHVSPMSLSGSRKESFNLSVAPDAKATSEIHVQAGILPEDLDGETLSVTVNGVAYSATYNDSVNKADSTKTVIGTADCVDNEDVAESIENSINLSISGDGLPIVVSRSGEELEFTANKIGTSYNATWSSSPSAAEINIVKNFTGGNYLNGEVVVYTTGSVPKGQYLRTLGSRSPINIANIQNVTSSDVGVKILGNYNKNYEVIQSSDRLTANVDFAYNNANYYTGSIPTAFLTPPSRRQFTAASASSGEILPESGSVDYAAPRQIAGRKITKSIIATRFAAPGSPQDSKQQFRDIASDQKSPNNALPFRNIKVRRFSNFGNVGGGSNHFLHRHSAWGGFIEDIRTSTNLDLYGPNSLNTIYNAGVTPASYATYGADAPNIVAGPPAAGYASPFHKTQRNTTLKQVESIFSNAPFSSGFTVSQSTGSLRDNAFVTRPIPQGDRNSWFIRLALGGSDAGYIGSQQQSGMTVVLSNLYNQFALSGSRYPQNITPSTSSLSTYESIEATAGSIEITVGEKDPAVLNNLTLELEDANGTTVIFIADSSLEYGINVRDGSGAPVEYSYGVDPGLGPEDGDLVAESFLQAIQAAQFVGDFSMGGSRSFSTVTLTQTVTGVAGNTTPGGTVFSGGPPAFSKSPASFAGGADGVLAYYADSAFTGTSGLLEFPWSREVGFVPWSQTRNQDKAGAKYFSNNNVYELYDYPRSATQTRLGVWSRTDASEVIGGTRTTTTRTGDAISYKYAARYVEPPITSKYKPMVHNLRTYRGTPEKSEYDVETDASLKYSYGNMLMGFANKQLNNKTIGRTNYMLGKTKRPYEIMRNNKTSGVSERIDGIKFIKLTAYPETIFPREIYTYLSGTRARLSCSTTQDYWRNDILTGSSNFESFTHVFDLYSGNNVQKNNRQFNRIKAPFYTSQQSLVLAAEQEPSYVGATSYTPSGDGSGSVWPMDSFLYSDSINLLGATSGAPSGFSFPEIDTALTGGASTLPAGELMMPHYGAIVDNREAGASGGTTYTRSTIASAQYVFTSPTSIPTGSHGNNYNTVTETNAPGGQWTRPPWSAGSKRRYLNGNSKRDFAPTKYPFYDSYEDYSEDIIRLSKDQSILPEFRVSEHISDYQQNGNLSLIQSTLSLTGASSAVNTTANSNFMDRYGKSDKMEFLKYFMSIGSADLEFNKYPKQLMVSSDATLKLLPYDGFYPAVRTVQLAGLFNSAYSDGGVYSGDSGSVSNTARFRPLLAPFFAPGILYNSIKSGVAVNYPVKRRFRNKDQYLYCNADKSSLSLLDPLHGCLSGTDNFSGTGRIPGDNRRPSPEDFITDSQVDKFFWSDKLPFESILSPAAYVGGENSPLEDTNINEFLYQDVTASIGNNPSDSVYRNAISNFIAAVPQFFLKKKNERFVGDGFMTKFVANFTTDNRQNTQQGQARKTVDPNGVYMMEIGLQKTDNFNMYNNPYAFGIPTATGSVDWSTLTQHGQLPSGSSWPKHRGEFAPYTPPYFYGPSVIRLTYTPTVVGENSTVTLEEILYGPDLRVEFINESGSYYDFSSGSYTDLSGNEVSTTDVSYGWNRAWQNRMDIDASLVVDNNFPIDGGGTYNPIDEGSPNRWVIMPKWETPVLDFRNTATDSYNFSSSVTTTEYNMPTYGMWHQYGVIPDENEGLYMFIRDVGTSETETRLLGSTTSYTGEMYSVYKVPRVVRESNRLNRGQQVQSLATLVGFAPSEIMAAGAWESEKAKRIGELAEDEEKTLSEAIVALPYYYDSETETTRLMTLRASPEALGPKIKEFRKAFTKYSFPPAVAQALEPLVPSTFPTIPGYINPFGGDDYDKILEGSEISSVPVVYMMEYGVTLSQQDLGDIWQGIMPEISKKVKIKNTSIDHYMPQSSEGCLDTPEATYPEIVLAQRLDQTLPENLRTGVPRPDLLDTIQVFDPINPNNNGFNPHIRWLVFKVKQRGVGSYTDLIRNEVSGYDSLTYEKVYGVSNNVELNEFERRRLETLKAEHARTIYRDLTYGSPKFNWPYDYFSLVETAKISSKVGFRPDLDKESSRNNRDGE